MPRHDRREAAAVRIIRKITATRGNGLTAGAEASQINPLWAVAGVIIETQSCSTGPRSSGLEEDGRGAATPSGQRGTAGLPEDSEIAGIRSRETDAADSNRFAA